MRKNISFWVLMAVLGVVVVGLMMVDTNDNEYPNSAYATRESLVQSAMLTSVATYPAFYTAEFGGATLTPAPMEKAKMIATNQALLAPTCPGIADLAGNCMEEYVYQFTIDPVCTPVACPNGVLICPSGDCPGGCGMVCKLYEPTPVPVIDKCVKVVWEKGTEFAGLNLRESPSMYNDNRYNSANPLGYLYRGNVFRPLGNVCNLEGCFAQYSDNGWVAMETDGKVYSIIVECP